MYAGALFIQQALHWDLYIAVAGLLAITAVYTVAGAWLSFRSEHSRSCSACACNAQNKPHASGRSPKFHILSVFAMSTENKENSRW